MFFRYLFWIEIGNRIVIGRIYMDGMFKWYIVIIGIELFISIIIDYLCKV